MSISALPTELLEAIAEKLASESHVNCLVRVDRRFHQDLNRYLYYRNDTERKEPAGNALYWAAREGRAETILRAEALGVVAPAPSLIAEAATYGQIGIVKLFFERSRRGGDAAPDLGDPTALILALENGHFDIFEFLVQEGADLEARGPQGDTALHVLSRKCDARAVQLLLERGADVDSTDDDGRTPLHLACERDDVADAELFLQHGASLDAVDNELLTPLHLAAEKGSVGALGTLLDNGGDIDGPDFDGWPPLIAAIESGQLAAAVFLVRRGADIAAEAGGNSALFSAVTFGEAGVAELLARRGARLTARDAEDLPSLIRAAGVRGAMMVRVLLREGVAVPRAVLEIAAEYSGPMLLETAIAHGNAEAVRILLESGVNAAGTVVNPCLPLMLAAEEGHVEIGGLLLDYGADAGATTRDGRTALATAAQWGHDAFVGMLRGRGVVV